MAPLPLAILVYSAQILVVVGAATAAAMLFRLSLPHARLAYWRGVGMLCLALPGLAPFQDAAPVASVVVAAEIASAGTSSLVTTPTSAFAGSMIVWIYVTGFAARVGWLLVGIVRLRQIRRRSTAAAVSPDLEALKTTLAPDAEFRWSDEVPQPVAFGLRRPVVMLPRRFAALDPEAQRSVACHEMLHVARRDWLWIVIEEHVRAVFWFHPAAWWILDQVQLSREQVIDRDVVQRTAAKRPYMDALIAFADRGAALTPSVAFLRRHHLKSRLLQLAKEPSMSLRRLARTMVALVIVIGTTAVGVARAVPLDVPSLLVQADSGTGFELRLAENGPATGLTEVALPDGQRRIYLHPVPLITASDVTSASVIPAEGAQFSVALGFSDAASARIVRATQAHLGKPVAILLDGRVISAPTLKSPLGDSAVITGAFNETLARRIAAGVAAQSSPAAAAARQAPVKANGFAVIRPVVLRRVNPSYTAAAMGAKIEGEVIMAVVVEADGSVGDVVITKSLDTVYGLDDEAVDAVKQWEFRPGTVGGKPVPVEVTIEMTFTMR